MEKPEASPRPSLAWRTEERDFPGRPVPGIKALLLAAGVGSRLRPLTDAIPKCLIPVAGRTLLGHWCDRLVEAGVREVLINTHAHADQVRAEIGRLNAGGIVRWIESHEPRLLGSAGTIAANPTWADDAAGILVIYADNLSDVDLQALLAFHGSHRDPVTVLLFHAPDPTACGIVTLDAEGRVASFVEKPARPQSDLANAGIYVVDPDLYREIARMGAYDLGFDVLPRLVGRMRGWVWDGYHRDVGTLESLEIARRTFPSHVRQAVGRGLGAQGQPDGGAPA